MWIEYKTKWSYGYSNELGYMEFSDSDTDAHIEDCLSFLDADNEWSEHYRGYTWDRIEKPPEQYLKNKILTYKETVTRLLETIERYEKLLE